MSCIELYVHGVFAWFLICHKMNYFYSIIMLLHVNMEVTVHELTIDSRKVPLFCVHLAAAGCEAEVKFEWLS